MEQFYWITRLSPIKDFAFVTLLFAVFISIAAFYYYTDSKEDFDFWSKFKDEDSLRIVSRATKFLSLSTKAIKISVASIFVSGLILVFTPSTKEALIIYGIGGTVDYLKNDSVAQKLPQKVIDACDAYLEDLLKDKAKE